MSELTHLCAQARPKTSDSTSGNTSKSSAARWLAAFTGAVAGTSFYSLIFWHKFVSPGFLVYADSHLPMLSSPDAYFFLTRAKAMLEKGLALEPGAGLEFTLAALSRLLHLPLELIAFWLPPILAMLACGLCFGFWGALLRLPPLNIGLGALAATLLPIWFMRTSPGYSDTDSAILLFWGLCLYFTARLALPLPATLGNSQSVPAFLKNIPCKIAYALLLGLNAALLAWFWQPGLLLLPFCLWLWGLSFIWAASPCEKRLRQAVAVALPLLGAMALLLPENLCAGQLALWREQTVQSFNYLLNPRQELIFQSINELESLSLNEWLTRLGGSVAGGLIALAAMLGLILRYPRASFFLVPSFFMLALSLFFNRFEEFAMLPLGLGLAALPLALITLLQRCFWKKLENAHPQKAELHTKITAFLLLLFVLGSEGLWHWQRDTYIFKTSSEDKAVLALRQALPSQNFKSPVALFNWWEDGYYLRYCTGLMPFFDGASQNPLPAFLVSFPMTTSNSQISRRWIRFFALNPASGESTYKNERGGKAWEVLVSVFGSPTRAFEELTALFSLPEDEIATCLQSWPQTPLLPGGLSWQEWLLPRGKVFLYLPERFLLYAPWWLAMGAKPEGEPLRQHVRRFDSAAFSLDEASKTIKLPEEISRAGFSSAGGVVTPDPLQPLAQNWCVNCVEPLVIVPARSPFGYLVTKTLSNSMGFRLLAPSWEKLPGFKLIYLDLAVGGAWEVLPDSTGANHAKAD